MSHTDKYLKYKNKYLEIKNQVGGDDKPLLLPSTPIHSFFQALILFFRNYDKEIKYFTLLKGVKINTSSLNSENTETGINNFAQKIANKYLISITIFDIVTERTSIIVPEVKYQSEFIVELIKNAHGIYSLKV